MNLYMLIEGRRTERKVYSAWLSHVFPSLSEVDAVEDVRSDHYFMLVGEGYPSYMTRISAALNDIGRSGNFDYFLICVDTEEMPCDLKAAELQDVIACGPSFAGTRLVLHDCCIETWFLAHTRMLRRHPASETLRGMMSHFDVGRCDPELMPAPSGYLCKAQFHFDYLREMLREQHIDYTKNHPRGVVEPAYLAALAERHRTTSHIASFGKLMLLWEAMGGTLP